MDQELKNQYPLVSTSCQLAANKTDPQKYPRGLCESGIGIPNSNISKAHANRSV